MVLIYFSPVRWESYEQRPHYMVRYFLEVGAERILWINPYPTRLPNILDLTRAVSSIHNQNTIPESAVSIVNVKALPLEPLPGIVLANRCFFWREWKENLLKNIHGEKYIVGVGKPCALALYFLRDGKQSWSFYDAMDNFPEFYKGLSKTKMRKNEINISMSVDVIITTTDYLTRKLSKFGDNIITINNACNMDALSLPERKYMKGCGTLTIGYIGAIAEWFDWSVVIKLANVLPNSKLVLVGPIFSKCKVVLPNNIELKAPISNREISDCIEQFDVGLIPFKVNPLTDGVDPIKYYEYKAMGLPILTTKFGQMAFRGNEYGVYYLESNFDAHDILNWIGSFNPDQSAIVDFRERNDWSSRFNSLNHYWSKFMC
jgi:hypothetical protein